MSPEDLRTPSVEGMPIPLPVEMRESNEGRERRAQKEAEDQKRIGMRWFAVFLLVTLGLVGTYLYLHFLSPGNQSEGDGTATTTKSAQSEYIENEKTRLAGAYQLVSLGTEGGIPRYELSLGDLQALERYPLDIAYLENSNKILQELFDRLGFASKADYDVAHSRMRLYKDSGAREEPEKLKKQINTKILEVQNYITTTIDAHTGFFWLVPPGIYLEVIFFAIFGVFAKGLKYYSEHIAQGTFESRRMVILMGKTFYAPILAVVFALGFTHGVLEASDATSGTTAFQVGNPAWLFFFAFVVGFLSEHAAEAMNRVGKRLLSLIWFKEKPRAALITSEPSSGVAKTLSEAYGRARVRLLEMRAEPRGDD